MLAGDVLHELAPLLQDIATAAARAGSEEPIRLTPDTEVPLHEVLSSSDGYEVVEGPYGQGAGPPVHEAAPGHNCALCGYSYFNGTRCVICGQMCDD